MKIRKFSYTPGWRSRPAASPYGHQPLMHVGILKFGLPIITALILAALFLWPFLKHSNAPSTSANLENALKNNPKLENKVINPRLNALDKKGRPFLIQAESALQTNPTLTDLFRPSGTMQLEDGTLLKFKADNGTYFKESNILKLTDHVVLTTDKGHNLTTKTAFFDLNKNQGEGSDPIAGAGPGGEHIQAQGFQIHHNSDTLKFTGRTRVSLPRK